ncbi:Immunoglobulin-binding protein 1 [Histomonas meleagridis]|uniref:Immunoglobulin-binding protein 1 n=1 Tax=Histomonas meleagridis TaxID=135588 RepID=UPI003559D2DE|nr:Immunoglobulin-binding protein 1 [Histomonas meleagridis]
MIFDEGVLPSAHLRDLVAEYESVLKMPPASEETAQIASSLIEKFTRLWEFFRRGQFYSSNEDLDEYSTSKLRFFLIPYYIGRLHLIFQGNSRPDHLETSISLLQSFSDQMVHFKVIEKEKPIPTNPNDRRQRAVAEYKEKRELEQRLQRMNELTKRDDLQRGYVGDPVDEETERELLHDLLRYSAMEARSFVRSAQDELPFARMRAEGVKPQKPSGPPPKMWVHKIEREEQMKKVFAPYDRLLPKPLPPDDETFAKPEKPRPKLDASDDDEAEQARKEASKWDDWKDDHPPFSQM